MWTEGQSAASSITRESWLRLSNGTRRRRGRRCALISTRYFQILLHSQIRWTRNSSRFFESIIANLRKANADGEAGLHRSWRNGRKHGGPPARKRKRRHRLQPHAR